MRIAGCGGLNSRDDAMSAGEQGADYVMFGDLEALNNGRSSFEAIVERVEWWADLFQSHAWGSANPVGNRAAFRPPERSSWRSARHWDDPRGAAATAASSRHACSCRSMHERRGLLDPISALSGGRPWGLRSGRRSPTSPTAPISAATTSPLFPRRPAASSERRPESDDVAGELYADGHGMPNDDRRPPNGTGSPPTRRPRSDVRARDVPDGGPRRPARPPEAVGCSPGGQARSCRRAPTISRCSISKASCSRRTSTAPPN